MIFDRVFVPWERVFMYREYEFAGPLVEKFASYHRQSYACKVGVGDVLIGASQTVAEYNGAAKASHIRDKIIEMNHLNETLYCGCIACAVGRTSGTQRNLLVDHAAGQCAQAECHPVSLRNRPPGPGHRRRSDGHPALGRDLRSPEVGKWIEKYCRGVEGVPVEDRMRVLRLIENLTLGSAAVGYLTESMHGAGSPQAQRIMISRLVDLKGKQRKAKRLCGIATESVGSKSGEA